MNDHQREQAEAAAVDCLVEALCKNLRLNPDYSYLEYLLNDKEELVVNLMDLTQSPTGPILAVKAQAYLRSPFEGPDFIPPEFS